MLTTQNPTDGRTDGQTHGFFSDGRTDGKKQPNSETSIGRSTVSVDRNCTLSEHVFSRQLGSMEPFPNEKKTRRALDLDVSHEKEILKLQTGRSRLNTDGKTQQNSETSIGRSTVSTDGNYLL